MEMHAIGSEITFENSCLLCGEDPYLRRLFSSIPAIFALSESISAHVPLRVNPEKIPGSTDNVF